MHSSSSNFLGEKNCQNQLEINGRADATYAGPAPGALFHQSAALHTDGKTCLTSHLLQGAGNLLTPAGSSSCLLTQEPAAAGCVY